jgi:ectoine hydroxylase-related dioxygenase (phytanoyl-CoA dioxygenase family)
MVFTRHTHYQQIELPPDPAKRNIYNSPINRITPRQDDILLFSSRLTHLVEQNKSSQPRHSIAFNTFVKGQLGDYRAVTELKL